jgi:tetratricopeptide (TPR) repeat protein
LDDVNLADFDYAFAFRAEGSLASAYQRVHLEKAAGDPFFRDRILIPELAVVLKDLEREPDKWYHHLKAGSIYWDWGMAGPARGHFEKAAALDESGNPYPPYYLGQTEEAQGNLEQAARHYRIAAEREPASPNPSFRESLERVTAKLGSP